MGYKIALLLTAVWVLTGCQSLNVRHPYPLAAESDLVGKIRTVRSRTEDTLPDLARRYNLGYEEIVAANPDVDPWLPGSGTRIVLPLQFVLPDAPREGIVINLATMRLFYFPTPGSAGERQTVITHPIGIGRTGWATPTGTTKITRKDADPPWRVPASIRREHARKGDPLPAVVPPGPDNPLGRHVLRLSMPSYLIHGTNMPYGVGMRVSHGCMRLYPEDIEQLYHRVPIDTPVNIVNQPLLVGYHGGTLYLEAHSPLEDDRRNWNKRLRRQLGEALDSYGIDPDTVDWDRVDQLTDIGQGLPVPILENDPPLDDITAEKPILARLEAAKDLLRPLFD